MTSRRNSDMDMYVNINFQTFQNIDPVVRCKYQLFCCGHKLYFNAVYVLVLELCFGRYGHARVAFRSSSNRFGFEVKAAVERGGRSFIPDDCLDVYATVMQACWAERVRGRPSLSEIVRCLDKCI